MRVCVCTQTSFSVSMKLNTTRKIQHTTGRKGRVGEGRTSLLRQFYTTPTPTYLLPEAPPTPLRCSANSKPALAAPATPLPAPVRPSAAAAVRRRRTRRPPAARRTRAAHRSRTAVCPRHSAVFATRSLRRLAAATPSLPPQRLRRRRAKAPHGSIDRCGGAEPRQTHLHPLLHLHHHPLRCRNSKQTAVPSNCVRCPPHRRSTETLRRLCPPLFPARIRDSASSSTLPKPSPMELAQAWRGSTLPLLLLLLLPPPSSPPPPPQRCTSLRVVRATSVWPCAATACPQGLGRAGVPCTFPLCTAPLLRRPGRTRLPSRGAATACFCARCRPFRRCAQQATAGWRCPAPLT